MQLTKGVRYSAGMHVLLLLLLICGLPDFMHRAPDTEPTAISVDILPLAEMSNVKPQEKPPEEKVKTPKEENTAPKAAPATKKEQEQPKEEAIPLPTKEAIKQQPKKPEKPKPKPKPQSDDLNSILNSVKEQAKTEESKKPSEAVAKPDAHPAKSDNYNPDMPLSMSEKDLIRNQFQKCWDVPAGAKDAYNLIVTLHIEVTEDGTVTKVELARDTSRYNSDSFFQAAADSAMRAVERCSPLKNLPADKYGSWRDMELTFDPKDMLY